MTCPPTVVLGIGLTENEPDRITSRLTPLFKGPIEFLHSAVLTDALAVLRTRPVDLVLMNVVGPDTLSDDRFQAIRHITPCCAVIAVLNRRDEAASLDAIRCGAHETLSMTDSPEQELVRSLARAFARVGRNASTLLRPVQAAPARSTPPALLHDLNNLMTSINGFADLLLARLAADDPARPSAEQVRLAGKRAAALLKAHRQARDGSATDAPTSPHPVPSPVTARAA
ncbi:MAG: hypothetical protein U0412_08385 [Nitrospira sp.]